MIAGLVLAAGRASRFGADKRTLRLPGGDTLIARVVGTFASALERVVVVARPGDAVAAALADGTRVVVVDAPPAPAGQGASLAAGIAALAPVPGVDGVLIGLADMPWVSRATVLALRDALAAGAPLVVPVHAGTPGHPRGVSRASFGALARLDGEHGARDALPWREAVRLAVDDPGVLADVDTPDDWARHLAANP